MNLTKKAIEALKEKRQNQGTINQNRTKNLIESNSQKLHMGFYASLIFIQ